MVFMPSDIHPGRESVRPPLRRGTPHNPLAGRCGFKGAADNQYQHRSWHGKAWKTGHAAWQSPFVSTLTLGRNGRGYSCPILGPDFHDCRVTFPKPLGLSKTTPFYCVRRPHQLEAVRHGGYPAATAGWQCHVARLLESGYHSVCRSPLRDEPWLLKLFLEPG